MDLLWERVCLFEMKSATQVDVAPQPSTSSPEVLAEGCGPGAQRAGSRVRRSVRIHSFRGLGAGTLP